MHLLAQGAPSTIHCTVGMRGTRGLRWGPHVRPTSDSSGRRTLAWRPQAISTVICGGGDIWKVQKVRNKRGPLKEERQPLTPGLQQTDRQTAKEQGAVLSGQHFTLPQALPLRTKVQPKPKGGANQPENQLLGLPRAHGQDGFT